MEYKWKYDYSMEEKELALLAQHLYEENRRLKYNIKQYEEMRKQIIEYILDLTENDDYWCAGRSDINEIYNYVTDIRLKAGDDKDCQ